MSKVTKEEARSILKEVASKCFPKEDAASLKAVLASNGNLDAMLGGLCGAFNDEAVSGYSHEEVAALALILAYFAGDNKLLNPEVDRQIAEAYQKFTGEPLNR